MPAVGASLIVVGQKPAKRPFGPWVASISLTAPAMPLDLNKLDSMRVFTTVIGMRMNPTEVLAVAPAMRLPPVVLGRTVRSWLWYEF